MAGGVQHLFSSPLLNRCVWLSIVRSTYCLAPTHVHIWSPSEVRCEKSHWEERESELEHLHSSWTDCCKNRSVMVELQWRETAGATDGQQRCSSHSGYPPNVKDRTTKLLTSDVGVSLILKLCARTDVSSWIDFVTIFCWTQMRWCSHRLFERSQRSWPGCLTDSKPGFGYNAQKLDCLASNVPFAVFLFNVITRVIIVLCAVNCWTAVRNFWKDCYAVSLSNPLPETLFAPCLGGVSCMLWWRLARTALLNTV